MSILLLSITSCKKDDEPTDLTVPVLTTASITKISSDSARCGGLITSDGGTAITSRGVCWSTKQSPTINGNKTTDGSGAGSFVSILSGLSVDTIYYLRAYATNSIGTAYGQQISYNTAPTKKELFNQMLSWMCGSFSSQNHADTTINQYIVDVRLNMAQIWSNRNAGENIYWLYVEQAYASSLNSPYRQRIYKVMMDANGNISDEIYAIPLPANYLHAYNNPSLFNTLTESDLSIKDGCDVTFTWNSMGQYFTGVTTGHSCLAAGVPGVTYITSDATLHQTYMTSWDRGYNASGVWTMGPDWPYIFDKIASYPFTAIK